MTTASIYGRSKTYSRHRLINIEINIFSTGNRFFIDGQDWPWRVPNTRIRMKRAVYST